eukprot:TRINITY_DN5597_c0_g2_i13.p1 TRINITY_DN5597_c0_g2~~TRINITY_DN5597_c0_g2_i13.p1  ORF type:complete len:128 (-),score=9.98 TRINITY_DN5597_c0_g2_i13:529-912(-)
MAASSNTRFKSSFKLTGHNNYDAWAVVLLSPFRELKLWDVVTGHDSKPGDAKSLHSWVANNRRASTIILNSVHESLIVHVDRANTSHAEWMLLEVDHKPKKHIHFIMAYKNLEECCCREGDTISDFV